MNLPGKHYLAALIWIALLGGIYVVIDGQIKPKVATATGSATEIAIPRSRNGHFYVAGAINDQTVTFLVDTGASTVSVGTAVAQRIGLPRGREVTVGTANGTTRGEEITGQTIAIGGIRLHNVRIVILPNLPGEALLGQNVLRHLEVVQTQENMRLRAKSP